MNPADAPAAITLADIDTPALLLDLDAVARNLQRMAQFATEKGIRLRPHVKLYKATPELARMQLAAGAIGMTCAKLSEAEVLADAGIGDILIANQIVGRKKIERLVELAKRIQIKVAVDHPQNIHELSAAAQAAGVVIGVLVEVNIGHNRCGVAPFDPTLELAQHIMSRPGLRFMGLMGYDGHCTLKVTETERPALSRKANTLLVQAAQYVRNHGIDVEIVSASGTFTYRFAAEVPGITEIQAGTYLLMDTAFQDHGVREFERTLSVLATVSSQPVYPGADGLVIIDTGGKSVSTQLGIPEVKSPAGVDVVSLSDEHGRIRAHDRAKPPRIGDKIELWVRDANGTINQFDRFYAMRGAVVEAVWHIPLCGRST